ncbi:PEPxxWA-CTERM sorting domain-containing protein [Sphingomonas profundi]|uniref:PEPxxWA-CTERM sorting domain-containing protein n=1 Tax=Alterirhizorhabdus profundi TaxID=2681549 RepID=UPI001E35FD88|nr:PEPxxWA-CTERM sorting domain-containing protein [Sphingomonas profundi]
MKMTINALAVGACSMLGLISTPASAANVVTAIGADLSASSYVFDFQGGSFTFGFNGDYFGGGPLTISTANGGEVNTVFGEPTTNFADNRGGPVTFGGSMQYAEFMDPTPIRFTNGDNFIGLRAVTRGGTYYGYAFSSNNVLNSIGFESNANSPVTAVAGVPEPTTWAMMLGGFGIVGGAMRRRRARTSVSFG